MKIPMVQVDATLIVEAATKNRAYNSLLENRATRAALTRVQYDLDLHVWTTRFWLNLVHFGIVVT